MAGLSASHILEERFSEPAGWQWGAFERVPGRRVRYGFCIPDDAKAILVYLPGLSEPIEKAFETARNALSRGYGFAAMDWFGQGGSGRYLENLHKRHAEDFGDDVLDFAAFIGGHLSNNNKLPLYMLAHSTGGNLGLRYLHAYPDVFSKAVLSAPLLYIHATGIFPLSTALSISSFLHNCVGTSYVLGGHNWSKLSPKNQYGYKTLTSDKARGQIQNYWFEAKPELQIGDVTYGWVHAALKSCAYLRDHYAEIKTPLLIARAGRDVLVDNKAIEEAAEALPNSSLMCLEDSKHEILMERDEIRDQFIEALFKFIQS